MKSLLITEHCGYQIICDPFIQFSMLQCWSQPRSTPFQTKFSHLLLSLSLTVNLSLKSWMSSIPRLTNDERHANCCTLYVGQVTKAPMKRHHESSLPSLITHPNLYRIFTSPIQPNLAPYRLFNFFLSPFEFFQEKTYSHYSHYSHFTPLFTLFFPPGHPLIVPPISISNLVYEVHINDPLEAVCLFYFLISFPYYFCQLLYCTH